MEGDLQGAVRVNSRGAGVVAAGGNQGGPWGGRYRPERSAHRARMEGWEPGVRAGRCVG